LPSLGSRTFRTRHWPAIDLHPGDVRPSAIPVTAARHQIHKTHFIDSCQVGIHHPTCLRSGHGDHLQRVKPPPAKIEQSKVADVPIGCVPNRSGPPPVCPVCQFNQRPQQVESFGFYAPHHSREPRHIDVVILVPQGQAARPCARSRERVRRIVQGLITNRIVAESGGGSRPELERQAEEASL
jgi:hypothetical protein